MKTIPLLCVLCLTSTTYAQQVSTPDQPASAAAPDDLTSQIHGNWITYRNGGYDIKRITGEREEFARFWLDGTVRSRQSHPIRFTIREKILFFTKTSPSGETIYEGIYKVYDGKLYEFNRGVMASTSLQPKVYTFERMESPMQQWLAAARNGDLARLKAVLKAGGDPHATNSGVPNALTFAAAGGHLDAVRLLVDHGADISRKSAWYGTLPLIEAAKFGKIEVCELLLELGADLQGTHNFGMSSLHETAFHTRMKTAEFLIRKGADLNARDRKGWTPLHMATKRARNRNGDVTEDRVALIALLLKSGADHELKNNQGQTALDIARELEIAPAINLLQK
jgi:ankyrin repeat protein